MTCSLERVLWRGSHREQKSVLRILEAQSLASGPHLFYVFSQHIHTPTHTNTHTHFSVATEERNVTQSLHESQLQWHGGVLKDHIITKINQVSQLSAILVKTSTNRPSSSGTLLAIFQLIGRTPNHSLWLTAVQCKGQASTFGLSVEEKKTRSDKDISAPGVSAPGHVLSLRSLERVVLLGSTWRTPPAAFWKGLVLLTGITPLRRESQAASQTLLQFPTWLLSTVQGIENQQTTKPTETQPHLHYILAHLWLKSSCSPKTKWLHLFAFLAPEQGLKRLRI